MVDEGALAEAAALVGRGNVLVDVTAPRPHYALEAGALHRIWNVIADDLDPDPGTIRVSDARKRSESVDIGDELAEPLDDPEIARVARYLRGGGSDAKLPFELAPSSIGVLVLGGGLDGLDASVGTLRAVVDWMRLELDDFHDGPRWYVRSCITITDGARTWRGCERVRFGWRVYGFLQPAADRSRATAELERWLGELELGKRFELVERILSALLPDVGSDTWLRWVETRLLPLVADGEIEIDGRHCYELARIERDGQRFSFGCSSLDVDREFGSFGVVKATCVTGVCGDAWSGVYEEQLVWGSIEATALSPAPTDLATVIAAATAGRAAFATALAASDTWLFSGAVMPHDVGPPVGLIALIAEWLEHGPPPPRPQRFTFDDAKLAADAARVRRVDVGELARLLDEPDVQPSVGYQIDAWIVLVCPRLDEEPDRIAIVHDRAVAATIMMSDPWNPASMFTVDGDAVTFRGAMEWLGAIVKRGGCDVVLPCDGEPLASEWIRCWDHERESRGEPLVDWRLQCDSTLDATFWAQTMYGFSEDRVARYRSGIALYQQFIVDVVAPPS